MSRKSRDLDSSDWFHVFNRGNDGQDIFSLPGDRQLFEALIAEAVESTSVEVHAFALMTNHFHLLTRDPNGCLSEFVRRVCARYAAAYNQRTNRSGALFEGRFGSVPIQTDGHLLVEYRYVERNPLDMMPAHLLANYRHSSFGCYLGRRVPPTWLTTTMLTDLISVDDYQRFVLDDHPSDRLPLGALPALRAMEPGDVVTEVIAVTGVDPSQNSGAARNLAASISLDLRIATVPELAELLQISDAGVRQSARRGRVSADTNHQAKRTRDRIVEGLRRSA